MSIFRSFGARPEWNRVRCSERVVATISDVSGAVCAERFVDVYCRTTLLIFGRVESRGEDELVCWSGG